jgi:hypothetical protein
MTWNDGLTDGLAMNVPALTEDHWTMVGAALAERARPRVREILRMWATRIRETLDSISRSTPSSATSR